MYLRHFFLSKIPLHQIIAKLMKAYLHKTVFFFFWERGNVVLKMCSGKAVGNRKDKDRNFQAELTFTLWNKLTENNEIETSWYYRLKFSHSEPESGT